MKMKIKMKMKMKTRKKDAMRDLLGGDSSVKSNVGLNTPETNLNRAATQRLGAMKAKLML